MKIIDEIIARIATSKTMGLIIDTYKILEDHDRLVRILDTTYRQRNFSFECNRLLRDDNMMLTERYGEDQDLLQSIMNIRGKLEEEITRLKPFETSLKQNALYYEGTIEEYTAENERLCSQILGLKGEVGEFKLAKDSFKFQSEGLRDQVTGLLDESEALGRQIGELEGEIEDLEGKIEDLERTIGELAGENDER